MMDIWTIWLLGMIGVVFVVLAQELAALHRKIETQQEQVSALESAD